MPKSFKTIRAGAEEGERWEDALPFEIKDIRDISKGEHTEIRLVGYVVPFMRIWVPTEASKAVDPYKLKAKQFPTVCSDFNSDTEEFEGNECLYRKAHYSYVGDDGEKKWGRLKPSKNFLIFYIDRERQEERAGVSLKKKLADPKKFSDIQCATVPIAFARGVQSAMELFEKKNKRSVDPCDPAEGFDLFFKFDKSAAAEAKYDISLGDAKELTPDELRQVELIPENVNIFPKDSPDKTRTSLESYGYVIVEKGENPDEVAASRKKGNKKTAVVKAGVELADDDEDEMPVRSKKKVAPKQSVVEDDEAFEDDDNDLNLDTDDDEEEVVVAKPAKQQPKAAAPSKPSAKPSKPAKEEDEDDADEDGFGEDEFNFDDED